MHLLLNIVDEASRGLCHELTERFIQNVQTVGFFRKMTTEMVERRVDGTLMTYVLIPKPCQGCERRYHRPVPDMRNGVLAVCTCGLTEADITWGLTTGYIEEFKEGEIDWPV